MTLIQFLKLIDDISLIKVVKNGVLLYLGCRENAERELEGVLGDGVKHWGYSAYMNGFEKYFDDLFHMRMRYIIEI